MSGMVNIKLEPTAGLLTVAIHKDWQQVCLVNKIHSSSATNMLYFDCLIHTKKMNKFKGLRVR